MKRFNKKENLGITLIALVITIVVLIILATVVINLSLGDNGIFNRARTAKEQYQNAESKEQTDIAKATNEIHSYVDGNRGNNSNNYSTEEQVIGTWTNGKTLYQKTIELNLNTDNSQTYAHNISNVDTIYVDIGNTFLIENNGSVSSYMITGVEGRSANEAFVNNYLCYIQSVNSTSILIRAGANSSFVKAVITLRYTKN